MCAVLSGVHTFPRNSVLSHLAEKTGMTSELGLGLLLGHIDHAGKNGQQMTWGLLRWCMEKVRVRVWAQYEIGLRGVSGR